MASLACTPPAPLPAPGDSAGLRERARGALLGLAVGDALGAPAENLRPSEIRARWGRITGYVSERPSGTDDTEYAIFSGLLLARHGSALTPAHVEAAWHEWIADRAEGPFRGAGFSERGTLENLRRGLAAPISAQHRHAWSDGLAMRAAPFGVFAAGRPAEAARLVAVDGSVSHEGEGIYGGQAVAAGVAAAMTGAPPPVVIASALAAVPEDSWTARSLRRAVAVAHRGERAVRSAVVIGGYPWTDLAPEAVALAFGAYAAADGDFRDAVLTAVNMGRDADTTAAVAGALAGAGQGISAIPTHWATAIGPARGHCLPSMAGHHILDVAELLVPEEGGKWGEGLVMPDFLPTAARSFTDEPTAARGFTDEPTEPLEPPATIQLTEPLEPPATIQLTEPLEPTATIQLAEPLEPAATIQPTELLEPTATIQLTDPVQPAGPSPLHPATVQLAEPVRLTAPPLSADLNPTEFTDPLPPHPATIQPTVLPELTHPTSPHPATAQPTEPPEPTHPTSPHPATTQPTEPPEPTHPTSPHPATTQPTEPPEPTDPLSPLPATIQLTEPPEPTHPTSPLSTTESSGEWAEERGSRGRSPLVGAGKSGQQDSEGR